MTYGYIPFEAAERVLVEELLQTALKKNEALQAASQDDKEASFYRGVRPVLQSVLAAVQENVGRVPMSEEQLRMLKGLLASSFTEFRESYQKAHVSKSPVLNDLKRQWALRDKLSLKLDAPFASDTSEDSDEGLFEDQD